MPKFTIQLEATIDDDPVTDEALTYEEQVQKLNRVLMFSTFRDTLDAAGISMHGVLVHPEETNLETREQQLKKAEGALHSERTMKPFFFPDIVSWIREFHPNIPGDIQAMIISAGAVFHDPNTVILERVLLMLVPPPKKEEPDD